MTPEEHDELFRQSVDLQRENQRVTSDLDARLTRERDENIRLSFAQAAITGLIAHRPAAPPEWFADAAFAIADAMFARLKR